MGQSNSSQSRSSRRQTSAAASSSSSSRTRSLRPATTTPGSHLPSPPSSSSSSPSRSPPLPPLPPTTLVTPTNNNNSSSSVSAAPSAAFLAPSSPTTTQTSTSGTMTSTTPHIYSHTLHQHQHQHPNHIHSAHSHHHSLQHQQQQQQQQQQQRPLGTSNTAPANSSGPIWQDHQSMVPVSTTATITTATAAATATAVTGASPSSSSATAPSRVLRSTTRRRRLLSAFYPLLSRNSSSRGDATAPLSSSSAEPSTSHTQSQSHGQSNRLNNNSNSSSSTPNAIPETRPPRHRQPDRPLSRNGLQPTQSTSRSSRGRSRVQRRYDEQSIRSLRSTSSRSSSVLTSPPPAPSAATGASVAASMSAAAPSLVPPTSMMSMHSQIHHPQTEPMELDHGVHTPTPFPHHYQQHQPQYHYQQSMHLQQQQQQQQHQQQQHMSLDPPGAPAHFMPVDHATPTRMTVARSRTDDSVFSGRSAGVPAEASLGSRPEASHTSSSRPDPSHVRFGGLFVGLSNPRGGTSISSSLMPIQPNSEDEDEYGHTGEDDRSQRRASSLYHHLDIGPPANDNEQQQQQGTGSRGSAGDSRRPRPPRASRYPPPDIVADLIQGQIEQALAESAAVASAAPTTPSDTTLTTSATTPSIPTITPSWTQSTQQQQQHQQAGPLDHLATLPRPNSSSTSLETVNNSTAAGESHRDGGSTSAGSSMSETPSDSALGEDLFGRRSTRVHRRRLRSSSLRGLLGFQPMSSVMTEERLTGNPTVESEALPDQRNRNTHGPDGNMDRPRTVDMRFFARLMAEFGRGLRGHSAQNSESGGDRVAGGSTTVATPSTEFTAETSLSSNSTTNGVFDVSGTETATATPLSTPMETTPTTYATSPPIVMSTAEPSPPVRPRRHTTIRFIQIGEGGRFDLGGGRRSRSRSTGAGQGSLRSDSPEGTTGLAREDLADAIIMLLSNASTAAGLEGESSDIASDGPEGSRSGRSRRSPWLVLTLSGAFLGSLLAGSGADGEEGGMSYDDLWALSNLIGPARPTTTTQAAIDNAGFHVGQFDDASKGMRGFHTLGDGSKCLVCMSDYEEGEDMRALSCKHGFHQECIDKWLTTGANKCPVCRAAAVVSSEPTAAAGGPLASEE